MLVSCLWEIVSSKMNARPNSVTELRPQWKPVAGGVALTVWAAALSVVIASLMVGHWVSLPHPDLGEQLTVPTKFLGSTTEDSGATGQLIAYHFLYGECPCSQRILHRLLKRPSLDGISEKIVLIGENAEVVENARNMGYQLDVVTPMELSSRYGVQSAPLMVVTDPDSKILYSGGYTTRKQGPAIQDESILLSLMEGRIANDLPVYGCAVSRELQTLVDPFRLKY